MTKGQRVWDTMKQAAAAMALPLSILKKAKSAGCDAFVGSRIYEDKLAPWLKEHRQEIAEKRSKEDVQIEKLLEEVRKLKIRNDREAKLVTSNTKLQSAFEGIGQAVSQILYQKLECEYPSIVSGLDIPGCRVMGARIGDSIMSEIKKLGRLLE